jgi:ComF family protein
VEPAFDSVAAPLLYGGELATAIRRLKFADRAELAPRLALLVRPLMAQRPGALIVPVPLSPRRLRQRGYDQAALLARAARPARGRVLQGLLRRVRDTPPVAHLPLAERARAVRGAFAVRPAGLGRLEGRDLVLFDDVVTTGATADACARALKQAGARRVDVIALARTP